MVDLDAEFFPLIILRLNEMFFSFLFLSSGNEESRESACSTTFLLPSTASRKSSARLPVGRETLLPESEQAPGCRWVFVCVFFFFNKRLEKLEGIKCFH